MPNVAHLLTYPFLPGGSDMTPTDGIPAPKRVFEDGFLKYGTGDIMTRDEYEKHFGAAPEEPKPKNTTKKARTRPRRIQTR